MQSNSCSPQKFRPTGESNGATVDDHLRKKSLLIVEDDAHTQFALTKRLSSAGFYVRGVRTAEEAVAASLACQTDAITLDVRLPDFDGIEAAARIRAYPELHRTPIIFISGGVDATLREACHRMRNCYFIRKPCDVSLLISLLKKITGNEPPETEAEFDSDDL